MEYHKKYLKYKNKYTNLKKQTGGNILKISGPVMIDYFYSKKFDKKIIIIGDRHNTKNGSCVEKSITITDYYNHLLSTDMDINFFIETDIPDKSALYNPELLSSKIHPKPDDYISEITNLLLSNYKKYPNKKIHFNDIRGKNNGLSGHDRFKSFSEMLFILQEQIISINPDFDFKEFFFDFNKLYIENLFYLYKCIRENNFSDNRNLVIKELSRVDEESREKITAILLGYLEDFFDKFMNPEKKISFDKINELDEIIAYGMKVGSAVTDIYTISRIIKSKEYKNCILYNGVAHNKNLANYLLALDFINFKHLEPTNKEFQCINDVFPFEKFFENEIS